MKKHFIVITKCNTLHYKINQTLQLKQIKIKNQTILRNDIAALILLLEVIRWDYTFFYILKCSWIIPVVLPKNTTRTHSLSKVN